MERVFWSLTLLLLLILILMGSTILVCSGNNPELYEECKKEFKCGNITARFPFWGNGEQAAGSRRWPECGHPRLQLFCVQDKASINFSGFRYRVLDIKPHDRILKITADMDALCRKEEHEPDNVPVGPAVLSIVGKSDYATITVVHGCDRSPSATMAPPPRGFLGRLNCAAVSSTDFVIIGNVSETEWRPWRGKYCSSISASDTATVVVPAGSYDSTLIMRSWSDEFDMNKLRSTLRKRRTIVEVKWNVDAEDECLNKCNKTEGACGFISPTPTPTPTGGGGLICYCLFPPHPLLPPNNNNNINMNTSYWLPAPTTCDPSITNPPPTTHTDHSKLANATSLQGTFVFQV